MGAYTKTNDLLVYPEKGQEFNVAVILSAYNSEIKSTITHGKDYRGVDVIEVKLTNRNKAKELAELLEHKKLAESHLHARKGMKAETRRIK